MTEVLGYERFGVCGGDGGSVIAQALAIDYPEDVIGIHLTDIGWHALNVDESELSSAEQKFVKASKARFQKDGAYAAVHASQPLTLAASLNDSPAGLASWIVDRFHSWADAQGELERRFSKDDLLTNITLYWVTRTIASSMLGYWEETREPSLTPSDRVDRPVALALFPADLGGVPPRELAERTLNVQRHRELPRGGHFGAMEEPELLATDIAEFFASCTGPSAEPTRRSVHERRAL